jgi:glycosyltransferase involved in cell wall biosynthesis
MKLLVFIPAWNEEDSIAGVIADVREHLPEADLLVINDGSTDATARRVHEAGVKIASLPFNEGVGAAHQTGYIVGMRAGYDICGHLDGDGQHPASELARLVGEVAAGKADLVVGSRFAGGTDEYRASFFRRIGQRMFGAIVSVFTKQQFTDTTSGMRALNRRAMAMFARRYSSEYAEVESLQQAVRGGLRVEELPVKMVSRSHGVSFLTPAKSVIYIIQTLIVLFVGQLRSTATIPDSD